MSAKDYPETVTDTTPPAPWWGTRPRDWREHVVNALIGFSGATLMSLAIVLGEQMLAVGVCYMALSLSAFVWWQRRRTPRPRQQRKAEAARPTSPPTTPSLTAPRPWQQREAAAAAGGSGL